MVRVTLLLTASIAAVSAAAKLIPIDVGRITLDFRPEVLRADVGDILEFRFFAGSHSVRRGHANVACDPVDKGGFYSGIVSVDEAVSGPGPQAFRVTVEDDESIYFYDAHASNCHYGMSGVVNGQSQSVLTDYRGMTPLTKPSEAVTMPEPYGGELGKIRPEKVKRDDKEDCEKRANVDDEDGSEGGTSNSEEDEDNVAGALDPELGGIVAGVLSSLALSFILA